MSKANPKMITKNALHRMHLTLHAMTAAEAIGKCIPIAVPHGNAVVPVRESLEAAGMVNLVHYRKETICEQQAPWRRWSVYRHIQHQCNDPR